MKPNVELRLRTTTKGLGPFHPAIQHTDTGEIWYWPNITFPTEDKALEWAEAAFAANFTPHIIAMQEIVNNWNIHEY